MTDFEQVQTILTQNKWHEAKRYFNNNDFCSKTSLYYFDYSNRRLQVYFTEYHGGTYSYQLCIKTHTRVLRIDYYHYYLDGVEISETQWFASLKAITKPLPRKESNPQYEQIKINIDDYIDKK